MAKKSKKEQTDQHMPTVAEETAAEQPVAAAAAPKATPKEDAVDFDTWYAKREKSIPGHHYREILRADFKARGIDLDCSTMSDLDKALHKYGVKLA